MVNSAKEKVKSHYSGNRRKKPVIEQEAVNQDSEKIAQNSAKLEAIEKQVEQSTKKQCMPHMVWLYLLLSGILGALIALGIFIGLQWGGLSSFFCGK